MMGKGEGGCPRRAVVWGLAALALTGCAAKPAVTEEQPEKQPTRGFTLQWMRPMVRAPGDGLSMDNASDDVMLTVTSSAGMGQAQLQPVDGEWPRALRIEFQYAPGRPFTALEGLRLQTRQNSFDSSGDWPALELEELLLRRSGQQFWIALPEGWLAGQQPLRLEWVDRYRR